jgi:hypothetical protein
VTKHTWKFFRAGGFDQVKLETGADLMNLDQLDLKLWVALACPTTNLEFSAETAALIDTDHDGRIRAPELIAAVRWAGSRLKNPDDLLKGGDALEFSAIADATLLASARRICATLGLPEASKITLAEVSDAHRIFADTTLNGDGVVIAESAEDDATRQVITEIVACVGSVPDRSGKPGVNQAIAETFFTECKALDDWHRKAEADAANIRPLGDATAAAAGAVRAIRPKVDDYFGRCRLAAFDPRAVALLNRKEEEYLLLTAQDLSITAAEVAGFPLAQVAAGKPLPLRQGVNPAHAAAVEALFASAVKPLLGERSELAEADWLALQARLAPYESWSATRAGAAVEKLGLSRVREILGGGAREAVARLIARDLALESEFAAITSVRQLLLYKRDLYLLCRNFVSFVDFYGAGAPAIFQTGTLYLDQRSCTLTLPVEDVGRHAAMAALAGSYLAYCDCVRTGSSERRQVVAAFTNGDSDNLMVGRNGLFYDRKGRDWDATITKIIENPISVRQAFWSPYKKLVRMIGEQVAKRAAAEDAAAEAKLASAATDVAHADKLKPEARKIDVGTVAAMGVAFGALATAFAAFAGYLSGLFKLPFWQVCLAFVGLLLLISGPAMVIAWLKLRQRNLGPILDANGWAVNAKARLNVPFGESLTGIAKLPPGHVRSTRDLFGEKPSPWPKVVLFVVIVCFLYSLLNQLYVLDAIYFAATGRHSPTWFTPAPGGEAPARAGSTHAPAP